MVPEADSGIAEPSSRWYCTLHRWPLHTDQPMPCPWPDCHQGTIGEVLYVTPVKDELEGWGIHTQRYQRLRYISPDTGEPRYKWQEKKDGQ